MEFQVFSMIPGFSSELMPKGREQESQAKIKRYMYMMDSMTNEGKSVVLALIYHRFIFYMDLSGWVGHRSVLQKATQ